MTLHPCTAIMRAVAVATVLTALSAPPANAQAACQDELEAVQNYKSGVGAAADQVRAAAAAADLWQQQFNDLALRYGSVVAQLEAKNVNSSLASKLGSEGYDLFNEIQHAQANMVDAARSGANALAASVIYKMALATAQRAYSQCLSAAAAAPAPAADAPILSNIGAAQLINEAESLAKQLLGNNGQAGPNADNSANAITPNPNQYSVPAGPALPSGQSTSTPAAIAGMVSALTNASSDDNNTDASAASNPCIQAAGVQPSNNGQAGPTAGNSPNSGPLLLKQSRTQMKTASAPTTANTTAATPQQASCPSGYVNWSCQNSQGTTSGCLTPQDAANDTAQYKAMGYTCSTGTPLPPNTTAQMQACVSKPPFLPWGGTGSATITVSGGKPCGIGWYDTGATILDSMSVTSPPSHGSLTPQDQHVIIFTPAPNYKGQDSFTLSMQEHNGGRAATLRVNVSVTIQ